MNSNPYLLAFNLNVPFIIQPLWKSINKKLIKSKNLSIEVSTLRLELYNHTTGVATYNREGQIIKELTKEGIVINKQLNKRYKKSIKIRNEAISEYKNKVIDYLGIDSPYHINWRTGEITRSIL